MVRIDKYLWAIRTFKTRTDAADACKSGKVKVNGMEAKPAKDIKAGDTIEIRRNNVHFTFKVIAELENRQPAKNVALYAENITPQSELDKLYAPKESIAFYRDRGTGRPTKKERRDIDSLLDGFFDYTDEAETD